MRLNRYAELWPLVNFRSRIRPIPGDRYSSARAGWWKRRRRVRVDRIVALIWSGWMTSRCVKLDGGQDPDLKKPFLKLNAWARLERPRSCISVSTMVTAYKIGSGPVNNPSSLLVRSME